jgi:hypothetical protein
MHATIADAIGHVILHEAYSECSWLVANLCVPTGSSAYVTFRTDL